MSFVPRRTIDLLFKENNQFEYLYYKLDSLITWEYFAGKYTYNNGVYTLLPKTINNNAFPITGRFENDTTIPVSKSRITVSTDIIGDRLNEYLLIVKLNEDSIITKGTGLDTLITFKEPLKTISATIYLPERYQTGSPTPQFNYISATKKNIPQNVNRIDLDFPVSYNYFHYKNTEKLVVKDEGKYWYIVEKDIRIKKGLNLLKQYE